MGGQIILESQLDKGTSLFITLPLAIASEDDIPQDTTIHHADEKQLDHLKNLRVLVVDDLAANRQLLQQQLAFIGIEQVMSADNGAEAWQILQHYSFDVVITDYNMPLMNGYELAAHIRSSPAIKEMIIIGCTADAREESNRRCTDAGMNDCMIKPVTIDTLRTVLLRQEIMGNMGADHHHTAGDNAVSAKNSDASQLPPSPQAAAQEKLRSLSGEVLRWSCSYCTHCWRAVRRILRH